MNREAADTVIPVFRPDITEEETEAVVSVLRSGWLGSGPQVRAFEEAFAESTDSRFAISTDSGTAALTSTLAALGVGWGDEVIIPAFTYVSVFQSIRILGGTPVLADVEPRYLTLDPEHVSRRITPRTKGILTVHHGGQLSDIAGLSSVAEKAGVWLIDDAAHAIGAKNENGAPAGSYCAATCFSFAPVKNLTTGSGGMVTTSDPELACKISAYRNLGIDRDTWDRYGAGTEAKGNRWSYGVGQVGQRFHMNDIAAALGRVQLRRLPELIGRRADIVARYMQAFADVKAFRWIEPRLNTSPSWHMFTVLMKGRDDFVDRMRRRGITVGVHYVPLHLYPWAINSPTSLPVSEQVWPQVTTFPLFPAMTIDQQDRVINSAIEVAAELPRE